MVKLKLSDFTFGIECENYVPEWRTDHEDTTETVSRIFHNYNGVLVYMRNMVERHKNDEDFWLHSFPEDKNSSCSAHIHFKANVPEWTECKYGLYKRMIKLVKLFNVFFKNSPSGECFSIRHAEGEWCVLTTLNEDQFNQSSRHYTALTINPSFDTIEFRYNEVPKHLNQLALFYYLLNIAINDSIDIPELPDKLEIDTFEKITKPLNDGIFSYTNKASIENFNVSYMELLENFSKLASEKSKDVMYDFINEKYSSFYDWTKSCINNDLAEFKEFIDKKMDQYTWSENHKKKFCKLIKKELIKEC